MRCLPTILVILLLLCPASATAGIVISMSNDIDPAAEFVVVSKIRYSGLHGSHFSPLGEDLLRSGETKSRTKLGVLPLLYAGILANAFHPAYYTDSSTTDKVPFLFRPVELPRFRPRSWENLLATGEPLREDGVGITAGVVNDHFRILLRDFLPTFDRLGGQEDLRRHLPLLEKLADFAISPQALENSQQSMRRFSRSDPDKYVESVKKTEDGYRFELMQRLLEIKGWLALDQVERRPMHVWLLNLRRPDYVFREVMDASDRARIDALLRATALRRHDRSITWTNPTTRIRFSFALGGAARFKDGTFGYSTTLSTDLNPRLGLTHKTRYGGQCYPRFIEDTQRGWLLKED